MSSGGLPGPLEGPRRLDCALDEVILNFMDNLNQLNVPCPFLEPAPILSTELITPLPLSTPPSPSPVPSTSFHTPLLGNKVYDNGIETDLPIGKVTRVDASELTLRPHNPSSPPRKKIRGGKRKYGDSLFEKPTLDLDEDNWARFYLIKKRDGTFSKDCSFKMSVALKNLIGKTKSVRKQGDGTLCVEAKTPSQADTIKAITNFFGSEVEVCPHKRLNTSQGVITCRDFLNSTVEDIKEGLVDEGVIDVRRIRRRQGDSLVDTASLVLTFDKPKPPTSIDAAFYKLKVRPYIPSPMRCFKCQRYGHTSQKCKATEQICVCGKTSHEGDCTPPIICVNCGGEHNAKSPNCPVLQEEKEVQKIKTLQQLPYHEARAIVRSESYVKPDATYAQKAGNKVFRFSGSSIEMAQAKSGPSLAQKGNIKKVGQTQPSNFAAPTGASVVIKPPKTSSAERGGEIEVRSKSPRMVRSSSPKNVPSSEGEWRVVLPQGRSPKKGDYAKKRTLTPRRKGEINRNPGDSRITRTYYLRRSPRPKWEVLGTDLEASESEGGGCSERPPTRKKKERHKGRPPKTFTD